MHKNGDPIVQQTRGFDETNFSTYAIRLKEDEDDYRYFPEPDLPPFFISNEMIEDIQRQMPDLPEEILNRLVNEYKLSVYDAQMIANDIDLRNLFFELASQTTNYKVAANWVIGPVKNHLSNNDQTLDELNLRPGSIVQLINLIGEGRINHGIATQKIFPELIKDPFLNILQFASDQELFMDTSQNEIDQIIEEALTKHSQKITEYKKGKKGLISLFVGEVMKMSKGKADAKLVTEKIIEKLKA